MVKIMVDIAADLPKEYNKEHNIRVLPFYVNFGEESILMDENYDTRDFYEKMKSTDVIPRTSQASPEIIENMFKELSEGGADVIYVSISKNASGVVNTATMIANQLNDEEGTNISIVDSKSFSMGIGLPVMEAVAMAEDGKSKDEIVKFLEDRFEKDRVYFVVDDLSYLKAGGRIKGTTAVIADLLDIKPVLYSNDGLVEVYQKVRGLKKATMKIVEEAVEKMDCPEENEIVLLGADADDKVQVAKAFLEKKVNPKKIGIYDVGPVIACHAGLGVFGIGFKHKG